MSKQKLAYAKTKIKNLQYIKDENELISIKEVSIDKKNHKKLNLRENGVEYVKINKKLLSLIKEMSKHSFVSRNINKDVEKIKLNLEKNVKNFLFDFLKSKSKSNIKKFSNNFTDIIVLDSTIRTSDIKKFIYDGKTNAPATSFHTDWWEGQSFSSMIISRFNWLKKLNKFGQKKYTSIENIDEWSCFWDSKYVELINVWIPFSQTTEACPLVFSDMNNTEYKDIIPYTYKVKYGPNNEKHYYEIATRLKYNKHQKLYSKEDMKIGEAIIFTSNKTPHTAYVTSKNKVPRKSIEFRCAVFNFDSEKGDAALNKLYKKDSKK